MIPKILKSTLFRAPCKKLYVGSKNDCNLLNDLDVLHITLQSLEEIEL